MSFLKKFLRTKVSILTLRRPLTHDDVESENLQKLCYEMDQMYIEQDFGIEAEQQDLIIVGGNDEEEMVTLELIPKNEDQKLPKKPQIQSCITQFFKSNKKWVLSDSMLKKYKRFIFPKSSSSPNKHIFVRAKKVCLFWELCLL